MLTTMVNSIPIRNFQHIKRTRYATFFLLAASLSCNVETHTLIKYAGQTTSNAFILSMKILRKMQSIKENPIYLKQQTPQMWSSLCMHDP